MQSPTEREMKLRVATVCSGIGAPERALELLALPFELISFSEVDEAAIQSYCSMHGIPESKNFGDLRGIDHKPVPMDLDLLVGGTPCQDFSVAGKNQGGDEGSGTRSSLMWYYLQYITLSKPKVIVWENVPGVLNRMHIHNFRKFYFMLLTQGYRLYVQVINAKFFNVPQNRERVFLVGIRKEFETDFYFPNGYDSGIRIKDILTEEDRQKYRIKNLENMELYKPYLGWNTHRIIRYGDLHWNRFRQNNIILSIEGISECLQATFDAVTGAKIYDDRNRDDGIIRRFSPRESFRLMGFGDSDYEKCRYKADIAQCTDNIKETKLYEQAGNSIVVTVLMAIFGVLFGVEDWEERVFRESKKTQEQLMRELPLIAYMEDKIQNAG